MGITKLENQNLNNDVIGSGEIDTGAVDSSKIGAEVKNISVSKLALPGHHHNLSVVMVHLVLLIRLVLMKMHLT